VWKEVHLSWNWLQNYPDESKKQTLFWVEYFDMIRLKCETISKKGVPEGVKPKAEITSIVVMKAESNNPSEDLPNQENNWYWTGYWWETGALYIKGEMGSDLEI